MIQREKKSLCIHFQDIDATLISDIEKSHMNSYLFNLKAFLNAAEDANYLDAQILADPIFATTGNPNGTYLKASSSGDILSVISDAMSSNPSFILAGAHVSLNKTNIGPNEYLWSNNYVYTTWQAIELAQVDRLAISIQYGIDNSL